MQLIPANNDFRVVVSRNNTILAFGTVGVGFISYDNAKSWLQVSIFDNTTVRAVFMKDDYYIAVVTSGRIDQSKDFGKSWQIVANLKLQIREAILSPDSYLLRTP